MRYLLILLCCAALLHAAPPAPLQAFTVKEYLGHRWDSELVHFDFDVASTAKEFTLTLADGTPLATQLTGVTRAKGRVKGAAWTVVTLEPKATLALALRPGTPKPSAASALKVLRSDIALTLVNEHLAVMLRTWPGTLPAPKPLTEMLPPFSGVCRADGVWNWLTTAAWVNDGPLLLVKSATTTILEEGPVRNIVEQKLIFTDGTTYRMTIELAAGQEAARITEESDVDAPQAGFRLAIPGANRLYWCSNYWREPTKGLTPTVAPTDKDTVICSLCPWSFWWDPDLTAWAGAFKEGSEPLVGVLALRPSRWSPDGWDGFARTRVPVTARANGAIDFTFGLLAMTRKNADGTKTFLPLRREWALTAGAAAQHIAGNAADAKLRKQLIRYSEFPLDEVKGYGFDFTPAHPERKSPFLIVSPKDLERARKAVETVPAVKIQVADAAKYLIGCNSETVLAKDGWQAYYDKVYIATYQAEKLPEAYIGTGDPRYAALLAAAVKGMTQSLLDNYLEKPAQPCIGRNGPWPSEAPMRLLLNYDLIAGSGALTPEEEARVRSVLVFAAHVLNHPDYWNTARGLCSANPNMTSSIILPKGLLGLYLDGHPEAAGWVVDAERELKDELRDWVYPGGAWIENPGYQSASLDGMFLLATALKNVRGANYFADPQFKATMDYYGYLLTPPDPIYPPAGKAAPGIGAPMTLPGIGDMFYGYLTPYNGWMAAGIGDGDPAFRARQQWFWQQQQYYVGASSVFNGNDSSGRAKGFALALTDPTLAVSPPAELSKAFPGFGSTMRTSWTDPKASYLCHRTGPTVHHYHDDVNSLVYYAKGAPLCLDFGNDNGSTAKIGRMDQPWQHNLVSFDTPRTPVKWGPGSSSGKLEQFLSLPRAVDYSYGISYGTGNQFNRRHLLLVKSADLLGANYVVARDITADGQPNQSFYWNLWCVGKTPEVAGNTVHFPGQYGVDLDVIFASPAKPVIETDHINLERNWLYVWGPVTLEQYGIHARKDGSVEDFLTVLYPRAAGQGPATVTKIDDKSLFVRHMEGADLLLLSPGTAANVTADGMRIEGEIGLARRCTNGAIRLALLKGVKAGSGAWALETDSRAAVDITNTGVTGESAGDAPHTVTLILPRDFGAAAVTVDGKPVALQPDGNNRLSLRLQAGGHAFTVSKQ